MADSDVSDTPGSAVDALSIRARIHHPKEIAAIPGILSAYVDEGALFGAELDHDVRPSQPTHRLVLLTGRVEGGGDICSALA